MTKLFFDIETLPADQDKHELLRQIFERRQKRAIARGKEPKKTFDEFVGSTTFDGAHGRIFCISWAVDDQPVQCLSGDEPALLKEFWTIAQNCDLFVGHNILDFDLRFILQRSIINRVKPSRIISLARYRSDPVFDIMCEWGAWNTYDKISLNDLALALGIPSPKGELDGSKVNEYYQAGRHEEICQYCNTDVETVRAIYRRITFQSQTNF